MIPKKQKTELGTQPNNQKKSIFPLQLAPATFDLTTKPEDSEKDKNDKVKSQEVSDKNDSVSDKTNDSKTESIKQFTTDKKYRS